MSLHDKAILFYSVSLPIVENSLFLNSFMNFQFRESTDTLFSNRGKDIPGDVRDFNI
jgi:hypothetical protein